MPPTAVYHISVRACGPAGQTVMTGSRKDGDGVPVDVMVELSPQLFLYEDHLCLIRQAWADGPARSGRKRGYVRLTVHVRMRVLRSVVHVRVGGQSRLPT